MQEEIGTGGAGFRFIYASFLQEAAQLLNDPALERASESMTDVGDSWRNFALAVAKECKQQIGRASRRERAATAEVRGGQEREETDGAHGARRAQSRSAHEGSDGRR